MVARGEGGGSFLRQAPPEMKVAGSNDARGCIAEPESGGHEPLPA